MGSPQLPSHEALEARGLYIIGAESGANLKPRMNWGQVRDDGFTSTCNFVTHTLFLSMEVLVAWSPGSKIRFPALCSQAVKPNLSTSGNLHEPRMYDAIPVRLGGGAASLGSLM
jgi:hypothetical protein